MKRKMLMLLGVAMLGASLCACGNKEQDTSKETTEPVGVSQVADLSTSEETDLSSDADLGLDIDTPAVQEKNEYGAVIDGDRAIFYYEGEYLDEINSLFSNLAGPLRLEVNVDSAEYWYDKGYGQPTLYSTYDTIIPSLEREKYSLENYIAYGDASTGAIDVNSLPEKILALGEDSLNDYSYGSLEGYYYYPSYETSSTACVKCEYRTDADIWEISYNAGQGYKIDLPEKLDICGVSMGDSMQDVVAKLGEPGTITLDSDKLDSGENHTAIEFIYIFDAADSDNTTWVYVHFSDVTRTYVPDQYDYVYSRGDMRVSGIEITQH